MENNIKKKNEIAIKRLHLCEQYFMLMHNAESLLSECHLNIAKTRKALAMPVSFGLPISTVEDDNDSHSKLPSVWIELVESDRVQNEENEDEIMQLNFEPFSLNNTNEVIKTDRDGVNTKFRPFGILEPQSARNARKNMQSVFPLLCDAANIRYQIGALDKEMIKFNI